VKTKKAGKAFETVFKKSAPPLSRPLVIGDDVTLLNLNKKGTVLTLPTKTETFPNRRFYSSSPSTFPKSFGRLRAKGKKPKTFVKQKFTFDKTNREAKNEIDVRGQNTEEAVMEIDKWIDKRRAARSP
jgi:DNA mismatch repair protein MutS2